jgi:hypothetical protein
MELQAIRSYIDSVAQNMDDAPQSLAMLSMDLLLALAYKAILPSPHCGSDPNAYWQV